MDANGKRAVLEEKRRRWMEDRQDTLAQNEAYSQTKSEMKRNESSPRLSSSSQISNSTSSSTSSRAVIAHVENRVLADESELFNRLTDKITKQIRRDVREELGNNINSEEIRNAVVDKMDRYLEAELHTHTCKICFELMTSPKHTPMLLFPCGHTFCRLCIDRVTSSTSLSHPRNMSGCPYCRQTITSMAVNQSLKDLIDNFSSQREKLKAGHTKFDDIFDSSKHGIAPARGNSGDHANKQGNDNNAYKMQIKANEMRRVILENQLQEDTISLEKLKKRKKNISAATHLLHKEKDSVEEKLMLLKEELELIDSHLAEQRCKMLEATADETALKGGMSLVNMSIASLQAEMDKLLVLSEHDS